MLAEHRPRLYITNSALHNPTGATLAAPVAHRLLTLAAEHGLLIVEDDIFADFESMPAPRLAAFDGLSRVVSIGSFSKTLSAAIRCGYVAARPEWIEALVDLKLATSFGHAQIGANVVHRLLVDGTYRRHVDSLRARLADAMGERSGASRAPRIWTEPRGGLFVWAELPDGPTPHASRAMRWTTTWCSRPVTCSARRTMQRRTCASTCRAARGRRCSMRWRGRWRRCGRRTQ